MRMAITTCKMYITTFLQNKHPVTHNTILALITDTPAGDRVSQSPSVHDLYRKKTAIEKIPTINNVHKDFYVASNAK